MKYIGNFADWLDPKWYDEVMAGRGDGRPKEGQKPDSPEMEEQYQKAKEAGYSEDAIYFWMFDKNNVSFELPKPPWVTNNFHWWITKMMPGNFMPMHIDPHTMYQTNSERYWIPLTDWQLGHIIMYQDQVLTNYKRGDVWVYDDSNALHGAANIGHTPRIILQVSTYD